MARPATSTQIRTIYSDGYSYITMKFYNTAFSFQFVPYKGKSATGRGEYDRDKSLQTTINYSGAFALYKCATDIIDGIIKDPCSITIPCAGDAKLILDCKASSIPGQLDCMMVLDKNNTKVEFKFEVNTIVINNIDGSITNKTIYSGLGVIAMSLNGYLTGINADRHLDKMTEDYIKFQETRQANTNAPYQKKAWGNYNTQQSQSTQTWESPAPNQENASTYKIPE